MMKPRRLRAALAALLCCLATQAQADPWLVTSIGSVHRGNGYNNFNPGVGAEFPIDQERRTSAAIGVYRNSFDNDALYGCLSHSTPGTLRLGAVGCVASGYATPFLVAAIASIEGRTVGANLLFFGNAAGLQLKYRF